MPTDPRVDEYIANAPEYARPLLAELRELVHRADPAIVEDIKWGAPAFSRTGIVCSLVAFKKHVALWLHQGAGIEDPQGLFAPPGAKKNLRAVHVREGERIDRRGVAALVKQAVALDAQGVKRQVTKKGPVVVPHDLDHRLAKSQKARAFFESLAPSHRRAFVEWITEAKREETRQRRVSETLELLRSGRRLDDKYR
jgi:hypothetical protein